MPLFDLGVRENNDKQIIKKLTSKKPPVKRNTILDKLNQAKQFVEETLGKYKDNYEIISTKERLREYLVESDNLEIAIDTETTGLDPISDKIVGLCLYRPTMKAAYIPINHVSYVTNERLANQLTEEEVTECIKTLEKPFWKIIMFNAKFDTRVLRNQLNIFVTCYWDCFLAARLMNENEEENGLKALHKKYVLNDAEDEFNFGTMFSGLTADIVPINTFYLYAAHDPLVTYELYEFQKRYMYYEPYCTNDDRNGMNGVSWVFFNIEMPCVNVCADMEDAGVSLDLEFAKQLSDKYTKQLEGIVAKFYNELEEYSDDIEKFRRRAPNNSQLSDPINIASPTQIAILLYDIIGVKPVDKKTPRGTGVDILKKIDLPICKIILEYREVSKLLTTYIDKLPTVLNPKDNKVHCSFNQYGADTGRMSSSDPNLQNIPSHNKEIRKMFVASNDSVFIPDINNSFTVSKWQEVKTTNGWKYADNVKIGDTLVTDDDGVLAEIFVTKIEKLVNKNQIKYYYNGLKKEAI